MVFNEFRLIQLPDLLVPYDHIVNDSPDVIRVDVQAFVLEKNNKDEFNGVKPAIIFTKEVQVVGTMEPLFINSILADAHDNHNYVYCEGEALILDVYEYEPGNHEGQEWELVCYRTNLYCGAVAEPVMIKSSSRSIGEVQE